MMFGEFFPYFSDIISIKCYLQLPRSNQSDEASVPESEGSSSSYNPSSQHPIPSPVEDVEATPMAHIEDGSVLYEHQSESDDLDSKGNSWKSSYHYHTFLLTICDK